jgi:hypothetical protein
MDLPDQVVLGRTLWSVLRDQGLVQRLQLVPILPRQQ